MFISAKPPQNLQTKLQTYMRGIFCFPWDQNNFMLFSI